MCYREMNVYFLGLRIIVNSLFHSLKPLGEVLLIMLFLLVVVSLIALQAYQGILRRRCVRYPTQADQVTSDEAWQNYVTNQCKYTIFFFFSATYLSDSKSAPCNPKSAACKPKSVACKHFTSLPLALREGLAFSFDFIKLDNILIY